MFSFIQTQPNLSNNSNPFELSTNQTDQDFDIFQSIFFKTSVSVLLSLISIFTLLGNLLVVVAVISTKSLHTITNSFIVSLAVADMLVPVFIEPMSIYMIIVNNWTFGSIICDFWIG